MSLEPKLPPHAIEVLHQFLRAHVRDARAQGVVLGLSGGIDSAVAAHVARDALGPAQVLGVLLPDRHLPEALIAETIRFAEGIGIAHRVVPVDDAERAVRSALPEVIDRVAIGNIRARLRMILLYAIARERNALVLGTGNKSEILLGYFTKYGDGAADLLPLGDLYKSDLRAIAVSLGIPQSIRDRPPSAGFWEGQTDEGELGLPYEVLDPILHGIEELRSPEEIASTLGVDPAVVATVEERVRAHRHKRRMAPIPKIRLRTVGIDWRD